MADITMCVQKSCPKRMSCYRFRAEPDSMWQSLAAFDYTITKDGECQCEYYWEYIPSKKKSNKNKTKGE